MNIEPINDIDVCKTHTRSYLGRTSKAISGDVKFLEETPCLRTKEYDCRWLTLFVDPNTSMAFYETFMWRIGHYNTLFDSVIYVESLVFFIIYPLLLKSTYIANRCVLYDTLLYDHGNSVLWVIMTIWRGTTVWSFFFIFIKFIILALWVSYVSNISLFRFLLHSMFTNSLENLHLFIYSK